MERVDPRSSSLSVAPGRPRAVITGALGQDGHYLASLLAAEGVEVIGVDLASRIDAADATCIPHSHLVGLDLTDPSAVHDFIASVRPTEFYHLAAEHHSSEGPRGADRLLSARMMRTNLVAPCTIADALVAAAPECRLLIAGSSQMYTATEPAVRIDEDTPSRPTTYYGMTKALSRQALAFYRERFGLFCGMAILFNHESVRRPETFLSRKVSMAAARIAAGSAERLSIHDPDGETDWSSAEDIVRGLRAMLRAPTPADYVLGSGRLHRVRDLLRVAFAAVGLDWQDHTNADVRPGPRKPSLVANPSRARELLGWVPSTSFDQLIADMVAHDTRKVANDARRG
jgi:GDPmannose 4,6-dehydratase